jgi:hypothetical protein
VGKFSERGHLNGIAVVFEYNVVDDKSEGKQFEWS